MLTRLRWHLALPRAKAITTSAIVVPQSRFPACLRVLVQMGTGASKSKRAFGACGTSQQASASSNASSRPKPAIEAPDGFVIAKLLKDLPATGLTRFDLSKDTPLVIVTKDGNVQGVLYSLCPHKKADLAIGDIEDADAARGCSVKCPKHRKKYPGGLNFSTRDGKAWVADASVCDPSFNADWSVPTFAHRVVGDWLCVSKAPVSGTVPPPPTAEELATAAGASTAAAAVATPSAGASSDAPSAPAASPVATAAAAARGFVAAKRLSELPPTGLTRFDLNADTPLVIMTQGGAVQGVLYALCPHKKADLSIGDIEDGSGAAACAGAGAGEDAAKGRGCSVKCPRHRKKYPGGLNFSAADGKAWVADASVCDPSFDAEWSVPVFGWKIEGDMLLVSAEPVSGVVPPPPPPEDDAAAAAGGAGDGSGAGSEKALKKEKKDKEKAAKRSGVIETETTSVAGSGSAVTAATAAPATAVVAVASTAGGAEVASSSVVLHQSSQQGELFPAKLLSIIRVNHDSSIYRFAVHASREALQAAARSCDPHCWHVELRLRVLPEGASAAPAAPAAAASPAVAAAVVDVCREYTPVSPFRDLMPHLLEAAAAGGDDRQPTVDLLIKHYERGALTSQLLAHATTAPERLLLEVSIPRTTVKTPIVAEPRPALAGPASPVSPTAAPASAADAAVAVAALGTTQPPQTLLLVGGGTGITPLMQLATWALSRTTGGLDTGSSSADVSAAAAQVALVFSSRTPADVLMHDAIGALARAHPHRLHVTHCITRSGASSDGCSPGSATAAAVSDAAELLRSAGIDGGAGLPNVTVLRSRINAGVLRQAAAALSVSSSGSATATVPARVVISGPDGFGPCVGAAAVEAALLPSDWAAAVDDAGHPRVVELEA